MITQSKIMAALQGDLETAGEFASVATEPNPQNAECLGDYAEVFFLKKEWEAAETNDRQALKIAPSCPEDVDFLKIERLDRWA